MTDMRPRTVTNHRANARLEQIGLALVIAQIVAAVWIGVVVARHPGPERIDYNRMTRPHLEAGQARAEIPIARYEAIRPGVALAAAR